MKYFTWVFSLVALVMGFITGRNSVINAQNKEVLEHAEMAKKVSEDIRSMSTNDLLNELRKKPSDK